MFTDRQDSFAQDQFEFESNHSFAAYQSLAPQDVSTEGTGKTPKSARSSKRNQPSALHQAQPANAAQTMQEAAQMSEQEFSEQIAVHCEYLKLFAMRKVPDQYIAEDLVQDTVLAALLSQKKNPDQVNTRWEGRSQLKVWLTGILKHKIVDYWREQGRHVSLSMSGSSDETDQPDYADALMNQAGSTSVSSTQLAQDPFAQVALNQFLERSLNAIQALPSGIAQVFVAREIEGEDTTDLCERLNLSEQNVWVRVHRARKALTQQLAHLHPSFA